jgi:hypothetical protein
MSVFDKLALTRVAVDLLSVAGVLHRYNAGHYLNGRWIDEEPVAMNIRLVHQPSSGEDLKRVPEGEYTEEMRTVWTTTTTLVTANESAGIRADEIEIKNRGRFKVIVVMPRHEGKYTRAVCTRINDRQRSR